MKINRLSKNLITSLIQQVVTLICGFILPRLILNTFGSSYNGIVNSVTQFLGYVTLLRAGVGGVTRAQLYKSLADYDIKKTSAIIWATQGFMRKIAYIFIVMVLGFAAIYPYLVKDEFDYVFSFSLILILSISTFSQYFFGITYQFLLAADQRQYVYNWIQIGGTIVNTGISVLLIKLGFEIRIVKLGSAVIFGLIPVLLYLYVKKQYNLDKDVEPDQGALTQRWDAFAHQVAAFVHSNTDVMILTIMTSLKIVSVYTVYALVINGIRQLITTCATAVESLLGNILAQNDKDILGRSLELYEWILNIISTLFFSCAAMLIVPFVMIYTRGVTDVNYNQMWFAYLFCFAYLIVCIRLPYQNVVEAAGHFRQTRNGAIVEAVINIITSIILVKVLGLIGVIIGTIISMVIRTVQYADYMSKNIMKRQKRVYIKRMLVTTATFLFILLIYIFTGLNRSFSMINSYLNWFVIASVAFVITSITTIIINIAFFPSISGNVINAILKRKN